MKLIVGLCVFAVFWFVFMPIQLLAIAGDWFDVRISRFLDDCFKDWG